MIAAAAGGHVDAAQLLVKAGADVNAKDKVSVVVIARATQ